MPPRGCLLLALLVPAVHAGSFSTYIASGQTTWAYHFGFSANTSAHGVNVLGLPQSSPAANPGAVAGAPAADLFNRPKFSKRTTPQPAK